MDSSFPSYEAFKSNFEIYRRKKGDDAMSTPLMFSSTMVRDKKKHKKEASPKQKNKTPKRRGALGRVNGSQQENRHQPNPRNLEACGSRGVKKTETPKRRLIPLPLPYRCRECGKEFKKIESLRTHFMQHLIYNVELAPPYICRRKECDRMFARKRDRKIHENEHLTQPDAFALERMRKMLEKL